MEAGAAAAAVSAEKEAESASYTYWVREAGRDAAPLPTPKKIDSADLCKQTSQTHLGSAWNRAGTWEEKNLNAWASNRIKILNSEKLYTLGLLSIGLPIRLDSGPKELLVSMDSLEFSGGRAEITEVTKCVGDAFLVTVRNKKRVGYTYELTLKVKGEWHIGGENKKVKGHLDVPEFTFGELDDLEVEVQLSEDKDFKPQEKQRINQDLKSFLKPLRERLLKFEEELKSR